MLSLFKNTKKLFARLFSKGGPLGGMYQAVHKLEFTPITGTSETGPIAQAYNSGDLGMFLNAAFKIAIAVGAMIVVLVVVWNGFRYMTSVSESTKGKAKENLTNAVIGLAILLGIVIMLEQINPCLLDLNVSFDPASRSAECR